MAITLTVILIYWCQCPRCQFQIKKYYLAIGWLLIIILVGTSDTVSFSAKDELFYENSIKRSVFKSPFHNLWIWTSKTDFFTIHAKVTLNSRWNKKIKCAFTSTTKGRSLEVPMKYTLFYKERFFSTQPQCCLNFRWTELQILLDVA